MTILCVWRGRETVTMMLTVKELLFVVTIIVERLEDSGDQKMIVVKDSALQSIPVMKDR